MQENTSAAPRWFILDFLLGLRLSELRTAVYGWGLYMTALTLYCLAYQKFVLAISPDLGHSLMWSAREWGIWVLLTPIAFQILRRHWPVEDRRLPVFLQMGAGILLVSLGFRVGLDVVTDYRSVLASLVIFLPRHLAALVVVALTWYLLLRSNPPAETSGSSACGSYPQNILVSRGSDQCLIPVAQIQYVSAARNYAEIYCNGQLYLMRATMQQIENLLPPSLFQRVHRSHIVNINEIERLKTRPPGNGEVRLRCGATLSVSRQYKHRLFEQYR